MVRLRSRPQSLLNAKETPRRLLFSRHAGASMTAAFQPPRTAPARPAGSRFFASPPRAPRHRHARPAKRLAGQKTAPGIFFAAPPKTHPETVTQVTNTHQESATYVFVFVPGCAVAPNNAGQWQEGLYGDTAYAGNPAIYGGSPASPPAWANNGRGQALFGAVVASFQEKSAVLGSWANIGDTAPIVAAAPLAIVAAAPAVIGIVQSPIVPRLLFQGITLLQNAGDISGPLLEGPTLEDVPSITETISQTEIETPGSIPPPSP